MTLKLSIMKMPAIFVALLLSMSAFSQKKPYYYQIPDTPAVYTPETVAARMVDGLGFRYFWATEGLTENDLNYRPSKEARSSMETLQHIDGLTLVLLNAVSKRSTKFPSKSNKDLSFAELREKTLMQIQKASELLKQPGAKLGDMDMIFESKDDKTDYPFWNLVNGPIADALWHVGQVVTFRRSSGNPLPKGVNVLEGTKTED